MTLRPLPVHVAVENRSISDPRVSPDASTLAFVARDVHGTRLALIDLESGVERRLPALMAPVSSHPSGGVTFDWLPGGSGLVYAAVDGTLREVSVDGKNESAICSSHGPLVQPVVSPTGTSVVCVADDGRAIAVVNRADLNAWPVRLSTEVDFVFDPSWSPDGEAVVWHEWDNPDMPWDQGRIVFRRADTSTPPVVAYDMPDTSVGQPRWHPDGQRIVFICDHGGSWNLWQVPVDHKTGEVGTAGPLCQDDSEHSFAQWGTGQRSFAVSTDGSQILFSRLDAGFGRLSLLRLETGEVEDVDKGVFAALHWQGDVLTAMRSGARTPTQIVTYNTASSSLRSERRTRVVGPSLGYDEATLVEPTAIEFRGDDGMLLHGRLYEPKEIDNPAGAPLLCWVHGGPTDQSTVSWNSRFTFFLSRGWSIFVPDHRGSTGWGREYRQALNGTWGVADVDDCAAGVRHCIEHHRVDARRIAAIGGSAGGFTALLLLARHSVLFAAGVAVYPVSDLVSLVENTWRFEKHYTDTLVGPLLTDRQTLIERSPLSQVGRINAPLLVLHGIDDNVVGVQQSRDLVAALVRAGGVAELVEYEGEGHGFSRVTTLADELGRTEAHLKRHVLDRF
jgi:dipeptidyl aminopeptidase/acylaminoacyl peptidase